MFTESSPTHGGVDEQEATLTDEKLNDGKVNANIEKQEGPGLTQPAAQSSLKIEILEVGTSDTKEINELKLTRTHDPARVETAKAQDTCEQDADADHEDSQLSADDADVHSTLQGIPPRHSPHLAAASVPASPAKGDINNAPFHTSTQLPERPGSRNSMHSLFSIPLEDERTASSQALIHPTSRNKNKIQQASPAHVPRHDSEAWKEPSFIAKRKGKGKGRAIEEPNTPKKRQRSARAESPAPKRVKTSSKVRRAGLGHTATGILHQHPDIKASVPGKIHPNNRPSTPSTASTEVAMPSLTLQLSNPRLASFVVDFERMNLGKKVPIPRLDLDKDIKGTLLRTGRIRTLGKKVEEDGSVYIHS